MYFSAGGIDLEDAEATYHQLFDAYSQFHAEFRKKEAQPLLPRLNINLPKLSMPSIKIQSPFVINKKESADSKSIKIESSPQEIPPISETEAAFEENSNRMH